MITPIRTSVPLPSTASSPLTPARTGSSFSRFGTSFNPTPGAPNTDAGGSGSRFGTPSRWGTGAGAAGGSEVGSVRRSFATPEARLLDLERRYETMRRGKEEGEKKLEEMRELVKSQVRLSLMSLPKPSVSFVVDWRRCSRKKELTNGSVCSLSNSNDRKTTSTSPNEKPNGKLQIGRPSVLLWSERSSSSRSSVRSSSSPLLHHEAMFADCHHSMLSDSPAHSLPLREPLLPSIETYPRINFPTHPSPWPSSSSLDSLLSP
jgi:hypothetical protein